MLRIANPFPLFLDLRGALLDAGKIYIGEPGKDPQANPVQVSFDDALAVQPLRTRGGFIVDAGRPAFAYVDADDYSIRVLDADDDLVLYVASVVEAQTSFQPADPDLDAIAALSTKEFGRSLLTLANQAALKAATGIPDGLPKTGGSVTGNILRQGAGAHLHHAATGMNSGRVFLTPSSASDPTSQPGDIWLQW